MAETIDSIVSVTIDRNTTQVSRQGFGTLLFIDLHKAFTENYRIYTKAADLLTDGFSEDMPAYIAAREYFNESGAPRQIYIGREHGDEVTLNVDAVQNSKAYSVKINSSTFSFTSDGTATANEITAGLTTAINAGAEPVTAVDGMDGTITLNPDVASTNYTVSIPTASQSRLSYVVTSDEDTVDAIARIDADNSDWYALATWHDPAQITAIAAVVEGMKKLYGVSSSESGIQADDYEAGELVSDTGNALKDGNYSRTFLVYHPDADENYIEASVFGRTLGRDPGTITWKFKSVTGADPVNLTATQLNNIKSKDVNVYTSVGGVPFFSEGTVSSGEYIDVMHGIDWLQTRLAEDIFSLLVNTPKVPFTNAGYAAIGAVMQRRLAEAVDKNVLASFEITIPDVSTVLEADKLARNATGITFSGVLAGAVHFVTITGSVTV